MSIRRTPRTVDDVGSQCRITVGGQEPLESGVNPRIQARPVAVQHLHADPARTGRDADPAPAGGGAERVRPVSVVVVGIHSAVDRIKPRTLVDHDPVPPVSPVVGLQVGMLPVHARIHARDHRAGTGDRQRLPDLRRADAEHAPGDFIRCRENLRGGQMFHIEVLPRVI